MKKIISALVFLATLIGVYIYRQNTNQIWYVRTSSEELICWGKDVCGWTWTNISPHDSKLIIDAGILQKAYPKDIIQKKVLLTIPKSKDTYSPISNYQITPDHIFIDIYSGPKQYRLYDFNKHNFSVNKPKINSVSRNVISSISPDQSKLLLSTFNPDHKKQEFYVYDLKRNIATANKYILDSFRWLSNDQVELGIVNQCHPTKKIDYYTCPYNGDPLNCSSFPRMPSTEIAKMKDPLYIADSLHLDIPSGWTFEAGSNLIKHVSGDLTSYFDWSISCTNNSNNKTGKIKILSPPRLDIESNLATIAEITFTDNYRSYTFSLVSNNNIKDYLNSVIGDFSQTVSSIKFDSSYPPQKL